MLLQYFVQVVQQDCRKVALHFKQNRQKKKHISKLLRCTGVCFSHASIADQMIRIANMGCNDILLTFSSLYWLSALCILMMSTLQGATRVITTDTFTPERLLSIIENYRVTFAFVASSHLVLIHKSKSIRTTDLSSIRQFMAGGSKPSREICIAMKKHFPCGDLSIGYGMTEMNGLIAIHFPYTGRDSVGKTLIYILFFN